MNKFSSCNKNIAEDVTEDGIVNLDKVVHYILEQRNYRELTLEEEQTIKDILYNSEPLPSDILEFVNKEFWNLI